MFIVAIAGTDGSFTYILGSNNQMLGYQADEMLGRNKKNPEVGCRITRNLARILSLLDSLCCNEQLPPL